MVFNTQMYERRRHLANVLGDQAAHHHALCVDEQVGLGLGWPAQRHMLETQLVVSDAAHFLGLKLFERNAGR